MVYGSSLELFLEIRIRLADVLPAQLEDGQHEGVEEGARAALDELPVEVAAPAVEARGAN